MPSAKVEQVGGNHYTKGALKCPHCQGEIQHWDIPDAVGMGYVIGCATKYLFRVGLKGEPIEQLQKAKSYIDKKIAQLTVQQEQTEQSGEATAGYTNQQ